jgi:hypothetical protein
MISPIAAGRRPNWAGFRRTIPSCSSEPLQRHQAADVVGEILQADLGLCSDDADRPYDSTSGGGLLSSEHMLDASPKRQYWMRLARTASGVNGGWAGKNPGRVAFLVN